MSDRLVHVPEGLDGERLDAALARMFGFSRTGAAELIAAGDVLVDGRQPMKSDRVTAGAELTVTLPPPPGAVTEAVSIKAAMPSDFNVIFLSQFIFSA